MKVLRARSLLAVGRCRVSVWDSSERYPINTMADEVTYQSLLTRQMINNRPSTWRSEKPCGHFHVFPAEFFPLFYEIYIIVNPIRKPGISL